MERILESAKAIWDYCKLSQPIKPSDYILALGSYDCAHVAVKAAALYKAGLSQKIIVSGGVPCQIFHKGEMLKGLECEIMKTILLQNGIPEKDIIMEDKARNTGDNFAFSLALIDKSASLIAVTIPFIERRVRATADIHCPHQQVCVTSFDMKFEDYVLMTLSENRAHKFMNVLVGSINRLLDYPDKGFQSFQQIPSNIFQAKNWLEYYGYKGDYQLENKAPKRHRQLKL